MSRPQGPLARAARPAAGLLGLPAPLAERLPLEPSNTRRDRTPEETRASMWREHTGAGAGQRCGSPLAWPLAPPRCETRLAAAEPPARAPAPGATAPFADTGRDGRCHKTGRQRQNEIAVPFRTAGSAPPRLPTFPYRPLWRPRRGMDGSLHDHAAAGPRGKARQHSPSNGCTIRSLRCTEGNLG